MSTSIKSAKMEEFVPLQQGGRVSRFLAPMMVFVLFIVIWELLCRYFDVKEYLVPAPSRILDAFKQHWGSLATDTLVTSSEALGGFMLANVISIMVAVLFSSSSMAMRSFYPYMIALKSVPIIAIAPLLVIWFGYGPTGKVIMSAIIAFFPLVVNATLGLSRVDPDALTLMHSLSATRLEIMVKLRLPNAMPYILSALKISSSLSVVGAIVAELTGAKQGLGFTIIMASYNIDTPLLFCAIILASGIGITFFGLISMVEATLGNRFSIRS
ncbi:MAG: ABC transporter permease [Magnetococcales bacterium]|nr:ABC transporter permease [Magnetococcales bacterium]